MLCLCYFHGISTTPYLVSNIVLSSSASHMKYILPFSLYTYFRSFISLPRTITILDSVQYLPIRRLVRLYHGFRLRSIGFRFVSALNTRIIAFIPLAVIAIEHCAVLKSQIWVLSFCLSFRLWLIMARLLAHHCAYWSMLAPSTRLYELHDFFF